MADTTNYGWVMPVVNASRNVWGTLLNTLFGEVDADLKAAENKADAAQADADALDTRVTELEGNVPSGWANWRSGQWYRPKVCEGLNSEILVMTAGRRYLVPFDYLGTFNGFGFRHAAASGSFNLTILDTNPDGTPGSALWSETGVSATGIAQVTKVISPSITLTRPCWLGITSPAGGGQIYVRGNSVSGDGDPGSGVPHPPYNWALGSNEFDPAATDIPYVVYGSSAPFTPITLGNFGASFGPDIALRTA